MTTRGTLLYLAAFATFGLVALRLDRGADLARQLLIGATAWALLALALRLQSNEIRRQVLVLVCVATVLEVVGSIVWGAYTYRLGNLPIFVPAGHGLFYLAALRAASLPLVVRHRRAIVVAVTVAATAWMVVALVRPPLPDLLGLVVWAVFMRFILRGRYPLLYAVSFVMTAGLEWYGTGLGIWQWSPVLPGLWLPTGNPPACIGAGYAAMDALTRRVVGRLSRRESAVAPPLRASTGAI